MVQTLLILVAIYAIIMCIFFLWCWPIDAYRYNRVSAHKVNPRTWAGFVLYWQLALIWPLIALGTIIAAFQEE